MRNLRDYLVVTGTYWAFTVTDGALRMLVLLYFHERGHAPLEIASLFLFYEFFGVVTNLVGGWLGARFGLSRTLYSGLSLQIAACGLLALDPARLTVPLVMFAQALSGVAKDLTKMSSKSYVKLVVPEGDERGLLRWVTVITGSKNTLKGVGFFVGGALLTGVGFRGACLGMAGALLLALGSAALLLPRSPGRISGKAPFRAVFSADARINWLAAARLLLFGSRDVWFVLALPIFLASELGWSHSGVGGFLALWIIGYGFVQMAAPSYAVRGAGRAGGDAHPVSARRLGAWTAALTVPLLGMLLALTAGLPPTPTLVVGLALFAGVFATNSALHSFLIVSYADSERVAMNVGFYYMANAAGRLIGTVLSGALFQWAGQGQAGLVTCLAGSLAFVFASSLLCLPLATAERQRNVRLGAAADGSVQALR